MKESAIIISALLLLLGDAFAMTSGGWKIPVISQPMALILTTVLRLAVYGGAIWVLFRRKSSIK